MKEVWLRVSGFFIGETTLLVFKGGMWIGCGCIGEGEEGACEAWKEGEECTGGIGAGWKYCSCSVGGTYLSVDSLKFWYANFGELSPFLAIKVGVVPG